MAKRGESRPYRVRYEWPNGIDGTETRASRQQADELAHRVAAYVGPDSSRPTVTVTHRDRPDEVLLHLTPPADVDEDETERAAAYEAQSTSTCEHGRLLWQSCRPCGVAAYVPPAGPVTY